MFCFCFVFLAFSAIAQHRNHRNHRASEPSLFFNELNAFQNCAAKQTKTDSARVRLAKTTTPEQGPKLRPERDLVTIDAAAAAATVAVAAIAYDVWRRLQRQ